MLKQNQTVAVASHLKPSWFCPFRLAGRYRHFLTDHDCAKIARHLTRHGISHTAPAVAEFCRRHGASYVDLDCIHERHPGKSLDRALHLSLKLDRVTIERSKQWIPVMPVIRDTRKTFEHTPTAVPIL